MDAKDYCEAAAGADSESVKIYTYLPEQIPRVWPHVRDYLESSLSEDSYHSLQDIYDNLLLNNFQLWTPVTVDILAAVVTFIQYSQEGMVCTVLCCGGRDIETWGEQTWKEIETHARDEGCKALRVWGRKGWAKMFGLKIINYEMKKSL